LCVSGGADSIALLMLMKGWISAKSGKLTVFHFDHKIRQESSGEAILLKKKVNKLGINCIVLNWDDIGLKKINMSCARKVRYEKIVNESKKLKILHLMTAHHFDDNIETFLMRKKREFSTFGLSAIPKKLVLDDVEILRPFLDVKKERLISTCNFFGTSWFNDLNNFNLNFERPRIRDELSNYRKINLSNELKKKKILNDRNEKKICNFFYFYLKFHEYGVFQLNKTAFSLLNPNLKVEILKKILVTSSGKIYPPRYKCTVNLIKKISSGQLFRVTLHGNIIVVKNEKIFFYREIRKSLNNKVIIPKGNLFLWDDRFLISSEKHKLSCKNINHSNWVNIKSYLNIEKSKIDFLIIKSLPLIEFGKHKIVPFLTHESKLKKYGIEFYFKPKIPLIRKNIF
jgi:tRNA(Ile)-lysidine synthase